MRLFMLEQPNRRSIDLSSLDSYGTLIELFDHTVRRPSIFEPDAYIEEVIIRLKANSFSADDAFVLAGAHTPCALALAALTLYFEGDTYNVAMYDSTQSKYVIKTVDLATIESRTNA